MAAAFKSAVKRRGLINAFLSSAFLALLVPPAMGQDLSIGAGYYTHCVGEKSQAGVECLKYLEGMLDTGKYLGALPRACPPRGSNLGTIHAGLLQYIKAVPAARGRSTPELLWSALPDIFPCQQ